MHQGHSNASFFKKIILFHSCAKLWWTMSLTLSWRPMFPSWSSLKLLRMAMRKKLRNMLRCSVSMPTNWLRYCMFFFVCAPIFFGGGVSPPSSLSPVHLQSEPDPPPDHNTQMLQLYPISIAYLIFIVVSVLWDKTCDKTIALLSL